MDIILSLVFSVPLLVIMIYPAMKILDYIDTKINIDIKLKDKLTIILTIILSLVSGTLLHIL